MQKITNSFSSQPHFIFRIFFILNVLCSTRFFSINIIDLKTVQIIEFVLLGLLFCMTVFSKKIYIGLFKNNFNYLFIFTLIASIPAYLYHNQAFYLSIYASRVAFYLFIYKFLHLYNFKFDYVLKVLSYVGILWVVIMIIQSVTFPKILFEIKSFEATEYLSRARGSIIRVNLSDVRFGVLLLMSFANFYFIKKRFLSFKLILFALIIYSLFLTGTRQVIFSSYLLLILLYFSVKRNKTFQKYFTVLFLVIPLVNIIVSLNLISFSNFNFLITKTLDDTNSENIRFLSAMFYLFEYWPENSPVIAYLFGNGFEHGQSNYGREVIQYFSQNLGFYRGDIGLIGALNKIGFLYCLTYIIIFIKFLKINYDPNSYYIKYFILFIILTSFTGKNHLENPPVIIIICCLAFIIDKKKLAYNKSKQFKPHND